MIEKLLRLINRDIERKNDFLFFNTEFMMSEDNLKTGLGAPYLPRIKKLTRRDFMRYTLAAGATAISVGAGPPVWGLVKTEGDAAGHQADGFRKLELTEQLGQNPAFRALGLEDGGLAAWVRQRDGAVLGYHLNALARLVWQLCDGARSREDIGLEYHRQTGRPGDQALDFIDKLKDKGLVVQGGYLLASPAFPDAPEPRRYLHRL